MSYPEVPQWLHRARDRRGARWHAANVALRRRPIRSRAVTPPPRADAKRCRRGDLTEIQANGPARVTLRACRSKVPEHEDQRRAGTLRGARGRPLARAAPLRRERASCERRALDRGRLRWPPSRNRRICKTGPMSSSPTARSCSWLEPSASGTRKLRVDPGRQPRVTQPTLPLGDMRIAKIASGPDHRTS